VAVALAPTVALADSAEGLWVGRAILNQVNEVVGAVDENQVRVQNPPTLTTPTSDQAEIFLMLHVDGAGQVRLLKSVVIADGNPDPLVVEERLITDPRLFAEQATARRLAAAAFEFGDPRSREVLNAVAFAAADAAASSAPAASVANAAGTEPEQELAAALAAAAAASAAAGSPDLSPSLASFVEGTSFQQAAAPAAAAALETAITKYDAGLRGNDLQNAVRSGVLIGLRTLSQMSDGATLDDLPMSGTLAKGSTVNGEIFLGAYHPSNPFRHRRNPAHRGGYDLRRKLTLSVSAPASGADFDTTDAGVDRLTGTYQEEVFGLHKPLGSTGEVGLRTKGTFILDRIGHDATLND